VRRPGRRRTDAEPPEPEGGGAPASQRIDKWLWHARVARTRTLAQELLRRGKIRVNRQKVTSASRSVRCDDVLTISIGQHIRVLKVKAFAERRGSASEAAVLFEEIEVGPRR
jgi:ribosome-associated heat shock protein Hsp15